MLAQAGIMAHVIARFDMQQTLATQLPFFHPFRRHVMVGLFLGSFGWFAHQLFFWGVQIAGNHGAQTMRSRLLDEYAWLTIPTYACIVIGAALVMTPYTASRFGDLWWLASASVAIILFLVGWSHA